MTDPHALRVDGAWMRRTIRSLTGGGESTVLYNMYQMSRIEDNM